MALPLTTIFTPPPSCSDMLYTYKTAYGDRSWYMQDLLGPGDAEYSACWPSSISSLQSQFYTAVWYSPGVCPSGWTAVSTNYPGMGAPTTATCCPSSFTIGPRRGCETTISTPTSTRIALDPYTTIETITTFVLNAPPIRIAWAESDLDLFTPKSAPILMALTATETSTSSQASSTAVPTQTSTTAAPPAPTGDLSIGAKAGIGVGISCAFIVALAVGILIFFLKKRQPDTSRTERDVHSFASTNYTGPTELRAKEPITQLDTHKSYHAELGANESVNRVDSIPKNNVYEMEAPWADTTRSTRSGWI